MDVSLSMQRGKSDVQSTNSTWSNRMERESKVAMAVEIALKTGLLFLVLYIAFLIAKPFLPIILWGVVLAVAVSPIIDTLEKRFGNRKKLIVFMALLVTALLVVPTYLLSDQIVDALTTIVNSVKEQKNLIVEPTQKVKEWPFVGERIYAVWESAHNNFEATLKQFAPQIKLVLMQAAEAIKSMLSLIAMTIASLVIAAVFLISKESSSRLYYRVMQRLLGKRGKEWADLSVMTVRSVANGVVGVAVLQAVAALAGMLVMGVPLAPLWALGVMFLTIIQLPALIIIGPVIAYVFSYADGVGATVFAVYMLIVGASDGVLKPILMGRGVDIPMLVVIIGAIGGMLLMGMIGLFLGAVVFALAYKLFMLWLEGLEEEKLSVS